MTLPAAHPFILLGRFLGADSSGRISRPAILDDGLLRPMPEEAQKS